MYHFSMKKFSYIQFTDGLCLVEVLRILWAYFINERCGPGIVHVVFNSMSNGRDIYPHRTVKNTECRLIIWLHFFLVENAATWRFEVANGNKISTYLVTNSGHLFFGVIQKESTSISWNFDLRFVSEETWIKSSFYEAMCLLCTADAPSGELAHSIQFVEVERNYFFSNPLDYSTNVHIYKFFITWIWCYFSNLLETFTSDVRNYKSSVSTADIHKFFEKLFILPLADIKISFPLLPVASLRLCHSSVDSDNIILLFN